MQATQIIEETAQANGLCAAELGTFLTKAGWDFSPFVGSLEEVGFIRKTVAHYASMILSERSRVEARKAMIEAASARAAATREKQLTGEARANPDLQCGKCNGSGRITAFSHIERGTCFQCGGKGIIRSRRRA